MQHEIRDWVLEQKKDVSGKTGDILVRCINLVNGI